MDLVVLHCAGSFFGYWLEAFQGKQQCCNIMNSLGLGCWPVLQVYGVGLVTLYLVHRYWKKSLMAAALFCAVLFTILECITGRVTEKLFGKRGWTYETCSFCSNYNSVPISIAWFCLSLFILWGMRAGSGK